MNKEELVQAVSSITSMPKNASLEAVDAVFEAIEESLISHEDVTIAGFGKFVAKYQKARDARNPKTGESIKVPARFSVKFSPSSILKTQLRSNSWGFTAPIHIEKYRKDTLLCRI